MEQHVCYCMKINLQHVHCEEMCKSSKIIFNQQRYRVVVVAWQTHSGNTIYIMSKTSVDVYSQSRSISSTNWHLITVDFDGFLQDVEVILISCKTCKNIANETFALTSVQQFLPAFGKFFLCRILESDSL